MQKARYLALNSVGAWLSLTAWTATVSTLKEPVVGIGTSSTGQNLLIGSATLLDFSEV